MAITEVSEYEYLPQVRCTMSCNSVRFILFLMISSSIWICLSQVFLEICSISSCTFLNDDALFISIMFSNSKFQAYDVESVSTTYTILSSKQSCVVSVFIIGIGGY